MENSFIWNIIGGLFISAIVCFICFLYLKNKKEGDDDYSGFNNGSSNIGNGS